MSDQPYDFGFSGYRPAWFSNESLPAAIIRSFGPYLGKRLIDIDGVMSQYGWEPDWPIIFRFETGAIAVNAMEPGEWTIDPWQDFEFSWCDDDPENRFYLSVVSLVDLLGLEEIRGKPLSSFGLLPGNHDGFCCRFDERGLTRLSITCEGDELDVRIVDGSQFRRIGGNVPQRDDSAPCPACGITCSVSTEQKHSQLTTAATVIRQYRNFAVTFSLLAVLLAFGVAAIWWKVDAYASRTAVSVGMSSSDVSDILGEPQQQCAAGETCHSATFPAIPPDQINDGGVWKYVTRHALVIFVYFDKAGRVKCVYSFQS